LEDRELKQARSKPDPVVKFVPDGGRLCLFVVCRTSFLLLSSHSWLVKKNSADTFSPYESSFMTSWLIISVWYQRLMCLSVWMSSAFLNRSSYSFSRILTNLVAYDLCSSTHKPVEQIVEILILKFLVSF